MELVSAVLAAVAISLTQQPTLHFACDLPRQEVEGKPVYGIATWQPPLIRIRPWVCQHAYRGGHLGLMVLAHEILHVRHDPRCLQSGKPYEAVCHAWIYKWDDWYAENVVRWKLRRLRG